MTYSLNSLLHPRRPDESPWRYLPLVLALGFIARAAVALSGDFVLHPDEIMQHLEPAHRLVFGNGISYWEYFYGARSWLVPGMIAGVLKLFDIIGLGEPLWYVGGVKLFFCALSLLIPAGMYFFARRHFSETAARVALVAGAFWYELVVFAHKPMTEFAATALLMVAFALCLRDPGGKSSGRTYALVAVLAVLAAAVRMQYAPLALFPLGAAFLLTGRKVRLVLVAAAILLVVGIFDAVTWNSSLFHSYIVNLRFNLLVGQEFTTEPSYQLMLWFLLAGGGLSLLCIILALLDLRRYGFVLASIAAVLLIHSLQSHKEYRFVFAAVPLWLLLGSDIVARLAGCAARPRPAAGVAVAAGWFVLASLGGTLNALPYQERVYRSAAVGGTAIMGFVRNQDPAFSAYRYLARAPDIGAVWDVDRYYAGLPGYYYLHNKIPFYDAPRGKETFKDMEGVHASVTHIVSMSPGFSLPGYSLEREFGNVRILRRDADEPRIRKWESYNLTIVNDLVKRVMKRVDPHAPYPPSDGGIRFAAQKQPGDL